MKGVSRSLLNNDTFDMIKTGNQIMASFPETLHCLMVINVPGWFGVAWSVVKKLIDPRTASKIEVVSAMSDICVISFHGAVVYSILKHLVPSPSYSSRTPRPD